MSAKPTEDDLKHWHRYFAIECNNRAWTLTTQRRSANEDQEMLDAAHASMLHWSNVGNELNSMRGKMLLAEVHSLLGFAEPAYSYAKEMYEYFLGNETPDWEIAFAYTIYAHAAQVSGDTVTYKAAYENAVKAIEGIADDEDREIVQKTLDEVPSP
ncbi:MAG: hypothetical protein HOE54_07225 [Gammaproteobacteria bacterium]|nr:hypothetical protein [Gammaproteobacteria bacterium]